ncbi:MAG TPA: SDR family NAD(P)-dependent oxidoreductase [Candidatus Poseidoniales archaeon]|nr:MAG TPA: SDR family NAD(P)-dependent oxidoreductase [Candidatus Poseidoniales archaeon]HII87680.1 SDR family NAD(P)-dependent oxidoreductase [Candidatus Poseidoniaceae archaeon]
MTLPIYVITGASKGLGRALALQMAEQGHTIFALARPSEALNEVEALLQSSSEDSMSIECDLADLNSIAAASTIIKANASFISGIVHNAGAVAPVKPIKGATGGAWARSVHVNLIGVQALTQQIYHLLGGEQQSRITTISSGASLRPVGSWSAYCVSKAGLDMWSRCMAEEGQAHNISSIAVAPGVVDTGMQLEIRSTPSEDFPSLQSFIDLHEQGQLVSSAAVAGQLLPLVTTHSMEQSGQRFDVREL